MNFEDTKTFKNLYDQLSDKKKLDISTVLSTRGLEITDVEQDLSLFLEFVDMIEHFRDKSKDRSKYSVVMGMIEQYSISNEGHPLTAPVAGSEPAPVDTPEGELALNNEAKALFTPTMESQEEEQTQTDELSYKYLMKEIFLRKQVYRKFNQMKHLNN